MNAPAGARAGGGDTRGAARALLILALLVTAARILYLFLLSPYSLAEDEAQYWEWSRHLDWSYYTKGPGVAWVIAACTWMQEAIGAPLTEAWVRLPSAISGGVLIWGVGLCALEASGGRRPAMYAALLVLACPFYQVGSLLMTIDPPCLACWSIACLGALRALLRGSRSGWWLLGAALACGFLFKYTTLLFVPGLLCFAIAGRRWLVLARSWPLHAAGGAIVGALGLVPVIMWNMQNDWGTIAHLLGHVGAPGGDLPGQGEAWSYDPMWTLEFIGIQLGLFGPPLVIAAWGLVEIVRGRLTTQPAGAGALLAWLGAPVAVFYLGVTLFTDGEGNWAASAYVSWLALGGVFLAGALARHSERVSSWRAGPRPRPRAGLLRRRPESAASILWELSAGLGVFVAVTCVLLKPLSQMPWAGSVIPAGRLSGGPEIAGEVMGLAARVSPTGDWRDAMIISQHYGMAHQLAFYLAGHPAVYSTSSRMGGRRTQHDFWEHTDLGSPGLIGKNAVCLGATKEQWEHLFERVEPIGALESSHKKSRENFLGYGYRGLGDGR